MRLAVLASHPVQYHAPLFRELAKKTSLHVFFAHSASPVDQGRAGFGAPFAWDIDLTSGYPCSFLTNVARPPGIDRFSGCDSPGIGSALRNGGFGALLVMGWHFKVYLQGIFAAKRLAIPVLVRGDSHLETPRSAFKRTLKHLSYPPFLRLFDAALYVGQRSRAYYVHYRYPLHRLFFSPHCVDSQWFTARATLEERLRLRGRFGISPEAMVLLFAGKLVSFKRPLDLVMAAQRCLSLGFKVEVMVAGSGELENVLPVVAASSGVRVHFLGFCNQTEMPAAYAAADCLVLPSDGRETWGLVANEAIACGRPIIVSDACGCAPDLAKDPRVGRSFKAGDIQALTAAICQLAASPPAPTAIHELSDSYSPVVAARGIRQALSAIAA